MESNELAARVALARSLQASKPKLPAKPKIRKAFQAIDRKHNIPKIVRHYTREYAFPAHMGNARNPLVFGKVPLEYRICEQMENEQVLQLAKNKAHDRKVSYR